jgi:hypothetical protein
MLGTARNKGGRNAKTTDSNRLVLRGGRLLSDKPLVAAVIAALAAVIAACFSLYQGTIVANIEARQKTWEVELRRRDERLETYQKAIDLLTDFGWRSGDKTYDNDIKEAFTIPFVRAANRVRVHGSPASVAAMDEIEGGFAGWNAAKTESEHKASWVAIQAGLDHLVDAARDDVGPKLEDGLREVPHSKGAGPRTF